MPKPVSTFVATSLVALALGLSACSSTTPATPSSSSADFQAVLPQDVGSTTSSAPDPDLASKLLTGEVAGFSLEQLGANVKGPLTELETLYHDSEEYQLDPAECDATGIEQLVVGSQASTGHEIATVALGTGTSSPQQHQQYADGLVRLDEDAQTVVEVPGEGAGEHKAVAGGHAPVQGAGNGAVAAGGIGLHEISFERVDFE